MQIERLEHNEQNQHLQIERPNPTISTGKCNTFGSVRERLTFDIGPRGLLLKTILINRDPYKPLIYHSSYNSYYNS